MVHITTGNKLDVVYDYDHKDGILVIKGLKRWDSDEIIPLPEPLGLIRSLEMALKDKELYESRKRLDRQQK